MLVQSIGNSKNLAGTPALALKLRNKLKELGQEVLLIETRSAVASEYADYSENSFTILYRLLKLYITYKPNLIYAHTHVAALPALILRLLNVPLIYECHGVVRNSKAREFLSKILNKMEGIVVKFSSGVVFQANAMKDLMSGQGKSIKKSIVIYPGLKVSEFSKEEINPIFLDESFQGKFIVTYIGTSLPYQGLDILANAQKELILLLGDGANLIFQILLSDKSSDYVNKHIGFDSNYTFVHDLESSIILPNLLRSSYVLVHTRPDTIDNVNVQSKLGLYLASGTTVLATDVGDYKKILKDLDGVVLTSTDFKDIAKRLYYLYCNKSELSARHLGNISRAEEFFDIDYNAKRLISFFNETLN